MNEKPTEMRSWTLRINIKSDGRKTQIGGGVEGWAKLSRYDLSSWQHQHAIVNPYNYQNFKTCIYIYL